MDLNVSPDIDAYYCYAIVLALGIITAYGQVSKRLTNLPGRWIMVNTWLLFFAYALLPVGLYWLLDRTGAIHDTSIFAAVLVGAGYQQIFSGGLVGIRPGADISKFWQPFAAWADHVGDRIRNRVIRNQTMFNERLFSAVADDPQKLTSLRNLAFTHTQDAPSLHQAMQDIDNQKGMLGAGGVATKTSEALYNCLTRSSPNTWPFLLYRDGITSRWNYYWYGKEGRSKAAAGAVAILAAAGLIFAFHQLWTPENRARYCIWRIEKANNTELDRYRAAHHLLECLQQTPNSYAPLAAVLQEPNLPMNTAENVLGVLLESRHYGMCQSVHLPVLMAESLRTGNPDVRTRINDFLLYLASEQGIQTGGLAEWKPSAKDSVADLDRVIKEWKSLNW